MPVLCLSRIRAGCCSLVLQMPQEGEGDSGVQAPSELCEFSSLRPTRQHQCGERRGEGVRIGLREVLTVSCRATWLLSSFLEWCVPGFSPATRRACHPPPIGLRDDTAAILSIAVNSCAVAFSIRAHGLARPCPLLRNCLPLDAVPSSLVQRCLWLRLCIQYKGSLARSAFMFYVSTALPVWQQQRY